MFFRKLFLPWTAADCFPSEDAFFAWLRTCSKRFNDLRMICLFPAAGCLLAGYILDYRPVMLLTILPLVLVLLLSLAMDRIDRALGGQNKSET